MPEQFYRSEEVTLAAAEVRVLNYDFIPDQILIVPRLDSIITDNIAVRPVGAQGGASHQLRGTGPLIVPGLSKQLQVKNNDLVSRIILVTAQKGYLPTSVVMPTTAVVPQSVGILSQLTSVYANVGSVTPIHPHVQDGWILVALFGTDASSVWAATSVTAAGKTGVLIRRQQVGGANGTTCEIWAIQDVPAGQQSATCVLNIASLDSLVVVTMSIDPAVGMGNSGALGWTVDAAQNVSLVNLEDRSATLWLVASSVVNVLETSNAEQVFDEIQGSTRAHCWRRKGQGTASFVLDGQGVGNHASVGIELRLSS